MSGDRALGESLRRPECYPHPVGSIEHIETHISDVFLTGAFAYKVKKPVNLGFLDFTSLEARRHYCEEELRLNRRLAPHLYLDVVAITGTPHSPHIGGAGPVIDHAVRMREFPGDALASSMLERGTLTDEALERLAVRIAGFHAAVKTPRLPARFGEPGSVWAAVLANLEEIARRARDAVDIARIGALHEWSQCAFVGLYDEIRRRRETGHVRECHGDLHLGNVAAIDGELVPFDCIEFNPELRWIDVISEMAFMVMDLEDRGAPQLAWLFLNRYLQETGDYAGLPLLRFYVVYRALVRAKVHLIRSRQAAPGSAEDARLVQAARGYLELAHRVSQRRDPAIVLMHGLSGSGKTTVARALARRIGAIHVRSDLERKRLGGLRALESSASPIDGGLYDERTTTATYARLGEIALLAARCGYACIVDAAFLQRTARSNLRESAARAGVPLAVVSLHAEPKVLLERVALRAAARTDASEATAEVVDRQMERAEAIADDEGLAVVTACDDRAWDALTAAVRGALEVRSAGTAPGLTRAD